jgi:hypothetical protein
MPQPILLPAWLQPLPSYDPHITLSKQRFYLGLLTPQGAEISGHGYARVELTEFTLEDTLAKGRRLINVSPVQFPTATGNWPIAAFIAVYDDPTGGIGHLLCTGTLDRQTVILRGDVLTISPGQLRFEGVALDLPVASVLAKIPKTIWERLEEED